MGVVWRSGGVLHADPHLPACVGVAPLGLELGLVFNHSPGSIQARWETLSVKQDSCLWWRVRVADTAPNAPNAAACGGPCGLQIPHQMHQMQSVMAYLKSLLLCYRSAPDSEDRWPQRTRGNKPYIMPNDAVVSRSTSRRDLTAAPS